MDDLPQSFVQYFRQGTWSEQATLGPAALAETRPVADAPYVRAPGHLSARLKRLLALGLRLSSRPLYVSPLLVPVAAFAPPPYDAYLAVAFVLAVVAFFALLVAFILWSVIDHLASRDASPTLAPPEDERSLARAASGPKVVRASGVVTSLRGAAKGTPVLVDLWCTSATPPWRATTAADFAVVAFGEPTVIVRHESAPLLLAEEETERFAESVAELLPPSVKQSLEREARAAVGPSMGGEARVLRVGDTVEVVAPLDADIPNLARFELGGETLSFDARGRGPDAPYRAGPGEPGRLLRSVPGSVVRIRRLGRAP